MTDSSCVIRYAGETYDVALSATQIHNYVVDKLNESAHRRGDDWRREHVGAADPELRPAEGGGGHEAQYNPFIIVPLITGKSVAVHVHDAMDFAILDPTGDINDSTLDSPLL